MQKREEQYFLSKAKISSEHLNGVLRNLKKMLQNKTHIEKSGCEDMVEAIDNLLQMKAKDAQDSDLIAAIFQAIDVLSSFVEDGTALRNSEECEKDLFIIGKALERTYIESVEIEQAQFFVKEIAIKIESLLSQKCFNPKKENSALCCRADLLFDEIRAKCDKYFKENIREIEEKPPVLSPRNEDSEVLKLKLATVREHQALMVKALQGFLDPSCAQSIPSCFDGGTRSVLVRLKNQLTASKKPPIEHIQRLQKDLQAELVQLHQTVTDLQSQVTQKQAAEKDVSELSKRLQEKENTYGELLKTSEALRKQKEKCEQSLMSAETSLKAMQKKFEEQAHSQRSDETEKTENLKQIIREDSKSLKQLLTKYEGKCVEVNELSLFKEKYNAVKEENAKLVTAQSRLEKDYLMFNEELRKLKDKVKSLLAHNDDLLSENLIYESKVGTLEDKIMALKAKKRRCSSIREKYSGKDAPKPSKYLQDQNFVQISGEQNSFYATVRKKDASGNSLNFPEKACSSGSLSAEGSNGKILRFNE